MTRLRSPIQNQNRNGSLFCLDPRRLPSQDSEDEIVNKVWKVISGGLHAPSQYIDHRFLRHSRYQETIDLPVIMRHSKPLSEVENFVRGRVRQQRLGLTPPRADGTHTFIGGF